MTPIMAIWKKDMGSFLVSPMFYGLLGVCCVLWGLFFSFDLFIFIKKSHQLSMTTKGSGLNVYHHFIASYLVIVHLTLVFILSVLSLHFFTEEKKTGTFSIYMMNPLSSWQILMGKWFVGLTLLVLLLGLSALFPLSLLFFTSLPFGLIGFGYFGLFLILHVFICVGLLASSLTESGVTCALLSFILMLALLLLGLGGEFSQSFFWQEVFRYLSFEPHFLNFRKGLFDLSSIVYLTSWSIVLLVLSERVIESARWR